ncbi:MAG: efflux RND transporter periplasmic adaptor subunit [Candidatus Stygibacter australis]|nr:efflux RND transporter periplasmic adaptor subunit [Candidatus Stygibacter australis]
MAKRNKKKKFPWLLVFILLIIIPVVYFKFIKSEKASEITYETSEISVMDIESLVSSTGSLAAVGTVKVGTQVSGEIDSIFVDYNDQVTQDQVLAILDRTTLKSSFRDAQANLKRVKAQYDLLLEKFANDSTLFAKEYISSYEFKSSKTDLINAETSLVSAEIYLEKADQNLNEYAVIRSPIDGLVISREIEEGQTVQASMSAPTLFILAEGLEQMEIEALVDESDIGLIKHGQDIRFTVEAYPDLEFSGEVNQVRLQSKAVSDVVHYTVICSADNSSGLLLPGMTATIDFVVDSREQVQAVTNSSLNISMPESVLKEMMEEMKKKMSGKERPVRGKRPKRNTESESDIISVLWYISEDGSFGRTTVEKGLSDGIHTEITKIRNLPDKAMIITKVNGTRSTTTTSNNSRNRMPGGHGPGLF